MSTRPTERTTARFIAALMTIALVASMAMVAPAAGAADDHAPEIIRIDGHDRFDTAARIATMTYSEGVTDVIVAAGFNFPDALAASGVGGAVDAPILLVNDVRDTATAETLDALASLSPATVHIAGGLAAVSATIEMQIAQAGGWEIQRFAGANRFDTAAKMALSMGGGGIGDATAIVATGRVAADSLAAGPLAHFAPQPILLTEADRLPAETASALDDLDIERVLVLGGTSAISGGVVAEIEEVTGSGSVARLAGDTRFDTAVKIADAAAFAGGPRVMIATGFGPDDVPADALSGGPHGGVVGAELLPINDVRDELPPAIDQYLRAHADDIDEVVVLGGTAAVSGAVAAAAKEAATGQAPAQEPPDEEPSDEEPPDEEPPVDETIPVVPGETRVVDTGGAAHALSFTADGLQPGGDYVVALFPCGGQSSDAPIKADGQRYPNRDGASQDGEFTFRDQNLDDRADDSGSTQNGEAEIVSVFGSAAGGGQATAAANAEGEIEFHVGVGTGHRGDCAIPVVWLDDGANTGHLDLDGQATDSWNAPVEDFGVGGAVVFHNGEAASGTQFSDRVLFLDTQERFVVLGDGHQYRWGRGGDEYWYEGAAAGAISQANFERYLSIGDELDSDAQSDSPYDRSGGNLWQLTDDVPGTPVGVDVELHDSGDGHDLQVSWDLPDPLEGNVAQFDVQVLDAGDREVIGTFATASVLTLAPFDAPGSLTIEDVDASTSHVVRVSARSVTGATGDWSLLSPVAEGIEPGPDPVEGVKILSQLVTDDRYPANLLSEGDTVEMRFDQEMEPTRDSSVSLRWEDGDAVYQVACVFEAGCSWSDVGSLENNHLTIILYQDPVLISGAGGAGMDISGEGSLLTFVSESLRSVDGVPVDLVGSPDLRLTN